MSFEVQIPWGVSAVNEVANSTEIEMLLLQQSIIDDLQRKAAAPAPAPTAPAELDTCLIKQIAELEIKLSTATRNEQNTMLSLADAQEHIKTLESSSAVNAQDLQQQIQSLTIQLAVAEQTKSVVLESNYDIERKAANKDYQMQTIQTQLDLKLAAFNKLHKDHHLLKTDHSALVEQDKENRLTISHLNSDVDGFDARIENMRKAERARILASLPTPAPVTTTVIDTKLVDSLHAEISDLKEKLTASNAVKSEMNAELMQFKSSDARLTKENRRVIENYRQGGVLVESAVAEMNNQADLARRLDSSMQKTIVEYSKQTIELDKIKRENMYLLQMLDYQEMRTIWTHKDGTAAYIISCDPSRALSLNDGEKDKQSMIHPVCWIMNTNGTGHIVLLNENEDELLYPNAAKGETALSNDHKDELLEAIKAVTIKDFNKSLELAVRRAQNVCNAADLLDMNWSEPLNVDRLLGEIMKDDLKKADMLEAQKSASVISKLAEMHRRGLAPKISTRNTATKNKRKRK